MAAAEQRDQQFLDDLVLANDDLRKLLKYFFARSLSLLMAAE